MNGLAPIVITTIVYCASLLLPALHHGNSSEGLVLLLMGWYQIFNGQRFAWLSNPLFFLAFIFFLLRKFELSFWMSLAAILFGLDTFRATVVPSNVRDWPIDSIGIGFYVWESSFVFLAAASWHRSRAAKYPSPP